MSKLKQDILIKLVVLLIAGGVHFYWTWPTYAFNLFYHETTAEVNLLHNDKLELIFYNQIDREKFAFTRSLSPGENQKINRHAVRVRYTRLLPDDIIILGLDKVPMLWLPLLIHTLILITLIGYLRKLVN